MREDWFGDKHDLIKWTVLTHIAEREKLKTIVQIPYSSSESSSSRQNVSFADERVPINVPDSVWRFFRNLHSVESFKTESGTTISVLKAPFRHADRASYSKEIGSYLKTCVRPALVFLDPDTGIAPSKPTATHVTNEDIGNTWSDLQSGEWLVVYQHPQRKEKSIWEDIARKKMEACCPGGTVKIATSTSDSAIFLYARKP